MEKGIVSSSKIDGKRGFSVYPIWDKTTSQQVVKRKNGN
jgi:hypothetical protein